MFWVGSATTRKEARSPSREKESDMKRTWRTIGVALLLMLSLSSRSRSTPTNPHVTLADLVHANVQNG